MGSHLFLLCAGAMLAALAVWRGLPRHWGRLPRDRGKAFVKDGQASAGKPTGAGFPMMMLVLPVLLLVLPWALPGIDTAATAEEFRQSVRAAAASPARWYLFVNPQWGVVGCLFAAMVTGFLDDKATKPWGRLKKGLLDAAVALATAAFLCRFHDATVWFPFWKDPVTLHWSVYIMLAVPILWLTMNATNCSDGVDGLAGTLTLMSLLGMAAFLYGVVGHREVAQYLLVPHNPEGARWAILCATVAGGTAGYLWYNAFPSQVLMGDAGSRALGLLVGVAALAAGNPFLVLVVAPVVLANGGTGLVKIVLLRALAKLGLDTGANPGSGVRPCWLARRLRAVRFPLHDECKVNRKWSNPQVLMRFMLLQAGLMPLLFLLLVKVR
jgi:phospho-N-acetylmuramoyl-pentapeptide-transferase